MRHVVARLRTRPAAIPERRRLTGPHVEVSVRMAGPFGASSQSKLDALVAAWCRHGASNRSVGLAVVDLEQVTELDGPGLSCLNRAYALLTAAGWTLRVVPPHARDPRDAFVHAAARGDLLWARGSGS